MSQAIIKPRPSHRFLQIQYRVGFFDGDEGDFFTAFLGMLVFGGGVEGVFLGLMAEVAGDGDGDRDGDGDGERDGEEDGRRPLSLETKSLPRSFLTRVRVDFLTCPSLMFICKVTT